jgi:hypothetical protein
MWKPPQHAPKMIWLALGLALIFLWGCAPTALEMDYGRSVSHNSAEEMVYAPGTFDTPPVGTGPKTAETVYETYNKSFKGKEKQERPTSVLLDVVR